MENELKFNSQVCTDINQSKKLLDLGLKPETADMHHYKWSEGYWDIYACPPRGSDSCYIPAWSLHRLIELLPQDIHLDDYADTHYYLTIDPSKVIYLNSHRLWIYQRDGGCLYDKLVDTIEWTIRNNFFNKEYLKQ